MQKLFFPQWKSNHLTCYRHVRELYTHTLKHVCRCLRVCVCVCVVVFVFVIDRADSNQQRQSSVHSLTHTSGLPLNRASLFPVSGVVSNTCQQHFVFSHVCLTILIYPSVKYFNSVDFIFIVTIQLFYTSWYFTALPGRILNINFL